MQSLSHAVKTSLPNYLSSLPVPDSVGGWFKLSCECHACLNIGIALKGALKMFVKSYTIYNDVAK